MANRTPPDTGTARILDKALALLERALPPPARLADLPCGSGYLTVRAAEEGYEVEPYDLYPAAFKGGPSFTAKGADLCGTLPIEDGEFDGAVCCEGIEHLENPWRAIRELHRVLRPGGVLVVSIPNTVDLRQRFRLLGRGHFTHYHPFVPDHVNLMGPFVLCHALLSLGFDIREIGAPKVYGGLPYRILSKLFGFRRSSRLPDHVRKELSKSEVLCGRTAVLSAVKAG